MQWRMYFFRHRLINIEAILKDSHKKCSKKCQTNACFFSPFRLSHLNQYNHFMKEHYRISDFSLRKVWDKMGNDMGQKHSSMVYSF